MRTAEWFACINFYVFDILIPQDRIITTEFNDKSVPTLSLDSVIRNLFSIQTPMDDSTRLFLKSRHYNIISTGCKIQLENIQLREFCTMPDILLHHHLNSGIIAVRFLSTKVQYLIDIQAFFNKWNNKNDFSTYS
ncbi:MAG: hypothetical protein IJ828_11005 [Treponema sp.]|nr:hypothetical protein [Treponema sp.]